MTHWQVVQDEPFPVLKPRPNPHLVPGITGPVTPSSESGVSRSSYPSALAQQEERLRKTLLWTDPFCFLTGSASADLEVCHVLSPVRGDDQASIRLRQKVEDVLSKAGFNGSNKRFELDGTYNAFLLDPSLRRHWDTYASFCFVPPIDLARTLLDSLKSTNRAWQSLINATSDPTKTRSDLPAPDMPWTVLVLLPDALLPNRKPLSVLTNPPLIHRPDEEPRTIVGARVTGTPIWEQYTTIPSSPFLWDAPTRTKQLTVHPSRSQRLSVWAMLLDADAKLEHACEALGFAPYVTPEVVQYRDVLHEIVEQLFWRPTVGAPVPATATDAGVVHPLPSVGGLVPDAVFSAQGSGPRSASVDVRLQEEDAQNDSPDEWDEEFDEDGRRRLSEDEDEDEDEDNDKKNNELTDADFDAAIARAYDPHIGANERVDAAKLLLFGGKRYEVPPGAWLNQ